MQVFDRRGASPAEPKRRPSAAAPERRLRHVDGVLASMGMPRPPRWQLWFTLAAMIAVLNCVIAGTTAALVVGKLLFASLAATVPVGIAVAAVSLYGHARPQRHMHESAGGWEAPLVPSPSVPALERERR